MSGQAEPPQFLMPILETAEHVVEAPSAPYAYSKYLYGVVNNVVSSLNTLISNSNANDVETRGKLSSAFDDRALIRSELSTAVADEATARQAQDTQLQTAIDELNTWRNNNTDEISMEVDKAINSKVDDTLFQSVKTALETQDTQFSQDLANSIANRESKDAEHDALIARLSKFVDILTNGVTVVDANGNPINSFADVVLKQSPSNVVVDATTNDVVFTNNGTDEYLINIYHRFEGTDTKPLSELMLNSTRTIQPGAVITVTIRTNYLISIQNVEGVELDRYHFSDTTADGIVLRKLSLEDIVPSN